MLNLIRLTNISSYNKTHLKVIFKNKYTITEYSLFPFVSRKSPE